MQEILNELADLKKLLLLNAKTTLLIQDVAFITGLSKSTIYKLTCSGDIPHYKRAKMLYFDKAEIEAWTKGERVATNEELMAKAAASQMKGGAGC